MTPEIILGLAVPFILRGFFTFGFLMKWGQALLDLTQRSRTHKIVLYPLSAAWAVSMAVSAASDILINVTVLSVLYWELPSNWNETYSYRLGRHVYEQNGVRHKIALVVADILKFLEGEDHVAYTYGIIRSPYPDLRILF